MKTIDPEPLYLKMFAEMGPQHWWPAESKMEIVVGAILVQNTNWQNVDIALNNLRQKTNLDPKKIIELPNDELQALIRPSGFYVNKAKSLSQVIRWFDKYHYDFSSIKAQFQDRLRETLLSLKGVGQETADSFLVYVFDEPEFIADKYARNLFGFLGCSQTDNYLKLKQTIKIPAEFTYEEAQEFHGLIDEFGKNCKSQADFQNSFLADFQL